MKPAVCVLLVSLFGSSVSAAWPLATSAAILLAQQTPAPKTQMKNRGLYLSGIGVAGAGGAILGWGLGTKRSITCVGILTIVSCEESGGSKSALIGVGAAIAGTGIAMSYLGSRRIVVAPLLRGIGAVGTLSF